MASLSSAAKTLYRNFWIDSRALDPLRRHLLRYLVLREGFRNDVYLDSKGIATVGIGHRVVPADKLQLGQKITNQRIFQLFDADFKRLSISNYTAVSWYQLPQRVAVASFIWTHGDAEFAKSATRRLMETELTSGAVIQKWVSGNWDQASPVNISRNKADLMLWEPSFSAAYGNVYQSLHASGDWFFQADLEESFFDQAEMITEFKRRFPNGVVKKKGGGNYTVALLVLFAIFAAGRR